MCESIIFYGLLYLLFQMLQNVTDGVIYTLTASGEVSSRVKCSNLGSGMKLPDPPHSFSYFVGLKKGDLNLNINGISL